MPVRYEVLQTPNVVLAHYEGTVSTGDVRAMFESYSASEDNVLSRVHIVDLTALESTDVGFKEVYALFSMYGKSYASTGETFRVGIVGGNEVSFGIGRIFENLAEQSDWAEAQMFDALDEALSWASQAV